MKEKVNEIKKQFDKDAIGVTDMKTLNDIRIKYLGKQGMVTELSKMMKDVPNDQKKEFGMLVNEVRGHVTNALEEKKAILEKEALDKELASEKIDITLPATKIPQGSANILERIIEEVEQVCMSMGYDVVDGPEIEEDHYNFELLNIPKNHPARDAQDTFYVEGDRLLLRSQTSPVQARVMLANKGEKPIRMICPGKTYRRDDDDATHSHQFMQIEGLLVDKNMRLSDLKGTFDVIAKTDISCFNCHGKGCSICKNTGWITVSGAGMVNPKVLEDCGYDPKVWSGFAFGFGAERLAMLKYGINDIRTFYNTDLRELKNFDRKEGE